MRTWKFLALLTLAATGQGVAPAQAQGAAGTATQDGAVRPRGVITPPQGVDPGMSVKAPAMPAQSTPVIEPKAVDPAKPSAPVVVPR